MVVSWVAEALLERLIGPYVKKNERKLDLSGGTMVIRGVELRPDVFDSLGLPVTVRGGEVGELEISVPWSKLRTESVVIRVHRLSLLVAPVCEDEWDEPLEASRLAARKERELQALAGTIAPSPEAGGADKSGWVDRLMERVLHNLQVVVTSAVVRLEDYSHSSVPFGVEVAMDSLWFHPAHVDSVSLPAAHPSSRHASRRAQSSLSRGAGQRAASCGQAVGRRGAVSTARGAGVRPVRLRAACGGAAAQSLSRPPHRRRASLPARVVRPPRGRARAAKEGGRAAEHLAPSL